MPNLRHIDESAVREFCRDLESSAKALATMPQSGYGGAGFGGGNGYWSPWGGGGSLNQLPPGAQLDYAAEAGELWRNSVVACVLGWLADNFGQATLVLKKTMPDGKPPEIDTDHDVLKMLAEPNASYSGEELWDGTITSFKCSGDAYWIKARGAAGLGLPLELWYEPHWQVRPVWPSNGSKFIAGYELIVDGKPYPLKTEDVIHFRASPDLWNNRFGYARLRHQSRHVVTLNRAENYQAGVVGNGGVKKAFAPERGEDDWDDGERQGIRTRFKRSTGDDAGDITILSHAGQVLDLGSTPEEMALSSILDRPEATICAALGVPAMVVGLAVGDATRTFSNLKEANQQAWKNGLIPMQKRFANALTRQLLPDFPDLDGWRLEWDYSQVEALSEDATEKINRAVVAFQGQLCTQGKAQEIAGLPVTEGADEVWYSPQGGASQDDPEEGGEADPGADDMQDQDDTADSEADDDPTEANAND